MTQTGDTYHRGSSRQNQDTVLTQNTDKMRFCIKALLAIFVIEIILVLLLSLLPAMPVVITAVLNGILLVAIIALLFGAQFKKEISLQDARFHEAQETLRKSEERYRSLVESSEDSIYLVNRQYRYLFMNQNHLARLGFSADEFLGRPYSDFHSEDETRRFEAAIDEIFATGRSIQQEHRSIRDGLYFLRTMSPVKAENGTITAVTVI